MRQGLAVLLLLWAVPTWADLKASVSLGEVYYSNAQCVLPAPVRTHVCAQVELKPAVGTFDTRRIVLGMPRSAVVAPFCDQLKTLVVTRLNTEFPGANLQAGDIWLFGCPY